MLRGRFQERAVTRILLPCLFSLRACRNRLILKSESGIPHHFFSPKQQGWSIILISVRLCVHTEIFPFSGIIPAAVFGRLSSKIRISRIATEFSGLPKDFSMVTINSNFAGLRHVLRRLRNRDMISLKLTLCALVTGVVTGAVCSFFETIPMALSGYRLSSLEKLAGSPVTAFIAAFAVSAFLGGFAMYLTKRFAPEAGGSGIPEIEGAMTDLRPVRFWRVLPVKFFGGIFSLSSGMILGREGPSIQIGGNLGAMVSRIFRLTPEEFHALLAAGAASGLASAFNAPLAGIIFVMEELRSQFRYTVASVQAVTFSVIASTITRDNFSGTFPVFELPEYHMPDLRDLVFFGLFGMLTGGAGVLFNRSVGLMQDLYLKINGSSLRRHILTGVLLGGTFGVLSLWLPMLSGSGMQHITGWITGHFSITLLILILLGRFLGILLCFCSGIPGGIFAPSLSLGTLGGALAGMVLLQTGCINFNPGIMAIVGMGAFFAASVRAPVTGIILVCEMTNNFEFLLPMMVAVFAATLTAGALKGKPVYTQILERTLRLSGNRSMMRKFSRMRALYRKNGSPLPAEEDAAPEVPLSEKRS